MPSPFDGVDDPKRRRTDQIIERTGAGIDGVVAIISHQVKALEESTGAALEGHGVTLVNTTLVSDDLASGALVRPFDLGITTDFACYLLIPEVNLGRPAVDAFRAWLLDAILT